MCKTLANKCTTRHNLCCSVVDVSKQERACSPLLLYYRRFIKLFLIGNCVNVKNENRGDMTSGALSGQNKVNTVDPLQIRRLIKRQGTEE